MAPGWSSRRSLRCACRVRRLALSSRTSAVSCGTSVIRLTCPLSGRAAALSLPSVELGGEGCVGWLPGLVKPDYQLVRQFLVSSGQFRVDAAAGPHPEVKVEPGRDQVLQAGPFGHLG